jgi:hypothetical protein
MGSHFGIGGIDTAGMMASVSKLAPSFQAFLDIS